MMTVFYADNDFSDMTQIDITEELPWYEEMKALCERVNRWSEKKMTPAAWYNEEEGKTLVSPEEVLGSFVVSIRLPDTDPTDNARETRTTIIALRALTDERCYLNRVDVCFTIREAADGSADTEQTHTDDSWVYEDKTACEMIIGLEAALRENALEMAEHENQETMGE